MTWVFQMTRTALLEPHTLGQTISCFLSPWRLVALHTCLLYLAPRKWWCTHTIRTTCVLHSSQGLQLCCSCQHDAWQCSCLSAAECHVFALPCRYISDAALSPFIFSFEMLSLITIQSSLRIHRLPLQLLGHYPILQDWNILSNLHTLEYYDLSPPNSVLFNHRLEMLLCPDPLAHHRHPSPHARWHHRFPGQTYYTLSPPHSVLIHHWLAMLLPPHLHLHHCHPHPHTR